LADWVARAEAGDAFFKSQLQALVMRRGYKCAIVDIAHKLLRRSFVMLQRHQPDRDATID